MREGRRRLGPTQAPALDRPGAANEREGRRESRHQLANRRGIAYQVVGPAVGGIEDLARIDTEFLVHGRSEIFRREHTLVGGITLAVGGTDDLAAGSAAAREKYRHGV